MCMHFYLDIGACQDAPIFGKIVYKQCKDRFFAELIDQTGYVINSNHDFYEAILPEKM